jgi:hypothetical protein
MIKVLESLIDRVAALPKEAQEEVVRSVVETSSATPAFTGSTTRSADILAALEEVGRGEVATDEEAAAVFRRLKE